MRLEKYRRKMARLLGGTYVPPQETPGEMRREGKDKQAAVPDIPLALKCSGSSLSCVCDGCVQVDGHDDCFHCACSGLSCS